MIKTILFDLDGTLLPMDQDVFSKAYFGLLAKKLAPYGYQPEELIDAIWKGICVMVQNDGTCTNEEAFWKCFCKIFGEAASKDVPVFEEFYKNEFQKAAEVCGRNPEAKRLVDLIKERGYRVVLATNPMFPQIATESRIRWAGLEPSDFEMYTTYENCHYCKPNLAYYEEILQKIGCRADECMMVGNDVAEDMVVRKMGMEVFLLTDCLINQSGEDISVYPHGTFEDLRIHLDNL